MRKLFFLLIDIPADAILELFGQTFFDYCQDSGYDKILQVLGATPRDFLQVGYDNVQFLSIFLTVFFGVLLMNFQVT